MSATSAVRGSSSRERQAGHGRGDRPEVAPDLGGGVGLRVPGRVLGRAAHQEQHDARPGPAERIAGRRRVVRRDGPPGQLGQIQTGAEHAEAADSEDLPTVDSVAKPGAGAEQSEHESLAVPGRVAVIQLLFNNRTLPASRAGIKRSLAVAEDWASRDTASKRRIRHRSGANPCGSRRDPRSGEARRLTAPEDLAVLIVEDLHRIEAAADVREVLAEDGILLEQSCGCGPCWRRH